MHTAGTRYLPVSLTYFPLISATWVITSLACFSDAGLELSAFIHRSPYIDEEWRNMHNGAGSLDRSNTPTEPVPKKAMGCNFVPEYRLKRGLPLLRPFFFRSVRVSTNRKNSGADDTLHSHKCLASVKSCLQPQSGASTELEMTHKRGRVPNKKQRTQKHT